MEIKITEVTQENVADLFILNEEFNGTGCTDIQKMSASIESIKDEIFLIAYSGSGSTPLGFIAGAIRYSACYASPYSELTELYVREAYRKNGVATALTKELEAELKSRGADSVILLTGHDNEVAVGFYEKNGYTNTKEVNYEKEFT